MVPSQLLKALFQRLFRFALNPLPLTGLILGPGVKISPLAVVRVNGGGKIILGAGTSIREYSVLRTYGGTIQFGEECSLNPHCVVDGAGGVKIGSGVRIGAHTVIVASQHAYDNPDVPIRQQGVTKKGIEIEDDVWIGAGVKILDGVHIGRGAIVGAGAVVTRSVPPYAVVAGVPARVIKWRGKKID